MNKSSSHDLIDAKLEEHQLCGSKHCPSCGHKLQPKPDWVGLPAGVKFDPTDQELIEHLEAKVEVNESKSHPLIDEFIPTIEGEDGICYTHPEKLPGVTKDGLSRHYFHWPSKAYTTGTRKRRKIQTECDLQGGETRWHKTGKTRPVMVNGKQKGCKKILVLYTNFGKKRKPEKTNWVMHQYHLGKHEDEREGELVVSKIFYQTQPRQCNWSDKTNDKEMININPKRSSQDLSTVNVVDVADHSIPSYTSSSAIDITGFKPDHFSFLTFRKPFDEVLQGGNINVGYGSSEERDQHDVTRHQIGAAFHVSRSSSSISTIISPPPPIHRSAIDMLHDQDQHSFHGPTIMLPNYHFQQQEEASRLEELIMACNSNDNKQDSSMRNPQESEWFKYSNFWPDPDNPDHHG